jgi:hypothetical protein
MADVERLKNIKDQIKDLANEALNILDTNSTEYNKAYSYWYPHILIELDKENSWLAGSMCNLEDTINEVAEKSNEEEDEDDAI